MVVPQAGGGINRGRLEELLRLVSGPFCLGSRILIATVGDPFGITRPPACFFPSPPPHTGAW